MSKFQKKIKMWDIVPKSPLALKPVFQPQPKKILPMADIVVSPFSGKSSKNPSLFFFSFGRLLIPRLLLRFLALFLAILLATMPVWPVLAEESVEEQNQEAGITSGENSLNSASAPKMTDSVSGLTSMPETAFDSTPEATLEPILEATSEPTPELTPEPTPESTPPTTPEPTAETMPETTPILESNESENESEVQSPIAPMEVPTEVQPPIVVMATETLEAITEDQLPTLTPSSTPEESEIEQPEDRRATSTMSADEELPAIDEKENKESEVELDVYEQIRRDLDSEWRSRVEEYRKKAEFIEEELRHQKELFDELLEKKLSEELEKELDQKCVKLEESGYYCLSGKTAKTALVAGPANFNNSNENLPAPKEIFSLKDSEKGNREIYLVENGITRRLTNNDYDDIFPALDIAGNLAVWQTLIGGRWQIFVYDLSSAKLTQLTNSDSNNMNPQIHNGRIVWQAWIEGNWEIYLAYQNSKSFGNCNLGIENSNDCWVIKRITNNHWHDMFPKIAGDLVTWQVFENNVWQLAVYNLKSGSFSRLTQGEEKAENPRFAVLWESRQGGQRKYFAYDLSSGELTEIQPGKEESPSPVDLPEIPLTHKALTVPATSSPVRADGLGEGNLGESEE